MFFLRLSLVFRVFRPFFAVFWERTITQKHLTHVLCGVQLQCVQQVKYLGVMLASARSFIHSISDVKEKFYRCLTAGPDCVSVQLLKSLCIPIILYSVEVLHLNKSTLASLDNVIDRAVFRIFGCNMIGDIKYIKIRLVFSLFFRHCCV